MAQPQRLLPRPRFTAQVIPPSDLMAYLSAARQNVAMTPAIPSGPPSVGSGASFSPSELMSAVGPERSVRSGVGSAARGAGRLAGPLGAASMIDDFLTNYPTEQNRDRTTPIREPLPVRSNPQFRSQRFVPEQPGEIADFSSEGGMETELKLGDEGESVVGQPQGGYKVQKDDTLYSIAAAMMPGAAPREILAFAKQLQESLGLEDERKLQIGMNIEGAAAGLKPKRPSFKPSAAPAPQAPPEWQGPPQEQVASRRRPMDERRSRPGFNE